MKTVYREHILKTIAEAAILAIFFFVGAVDAKTIIVDDSGGMDYTRIQDAINNSSPGDTIFVYSGTYYENVNVSKQLILKGIDNGKGLPVINAKGEGSAVNLNADGCIIENFIAMNATRIWSGYAGIFVTSNNNIISNNRVSNNSHGIYLSSSNNNIVSGNTASDNPTGIYLYHSINNTLSGNAATSSGYGILLSSSVYNVLTGNNVSNNHDYGINLDGSSKNILRGNRVLNNGIGIYLYVSKNNMLNGNIVSKNSRGIDMEWSSNGNTLHSNIIENNYIHGISHYVSSNIIYDNFFKNSNNFEFGIGNSMNKLNTSKTVETNILGGAYLGGNVWASPDGKGFSQTCPDSDGDGICDSPYTINGKNTDYLPLEYKLSIEPATKITVVTPTEIIETPKLTLTVNETAGATEKVSGFEAVLVMAILSIMHILGRKRR